MSLIKDLKSVTRDVELFLNNAVEEKNNGHVELSINILETEPSAFDEINDYLESAYDHLKYVQDTIQLLDELDVSEDYINLQEYSDLINRLNTIKKLLNNAYYTISSVVHNRPASLLLEEEKALENLFNFLGELNEANTSLNSEKLASAT